MNNVWDFGEYVVGYHYYFDEEVLLGGLIIIENPNVEGTEEKFYVSGTRALKVMLLDPVPVDSKEGAEPTIWRKFLGRFDEGDRPLKRIFNRSGPVRWMDKEYIYELYRNPVVVFEYHHENDVYGWEVIQSD